MKCRLRRAFLPALALLAVFAPLAAAAAPPLVIRNARVFDGVRVIGVASVLVENGRITSIAGKTAVPAGATIVDAAGMTLLPGLIDSHAHAFGGALEQAPVFGVTTILDMFTTVGFAAERRAEQRAGKADARADLFSAGTLVTAPKGHGTEYGVPIPTLASPQGAAEFVDGRLAEGSDYIKIVYDDGAAFGLHSVVTLSRETLAAVIAATHARRKLAVVHIGSLEGAREAVEAGANGLAHLFGDRAADEAFVKLAMKRRTFVIPTLSVIESVTGVASGAGLVRDTSMAPLLTAEDVANLKRSFPKRSESPTSLARASETLRKLAAAGVHILAGTDAPNPGTAHGVSLHRELELLVAAGLSPVQALAAATSVPAESFGLRDRGRIAPGRRADLLLVKGDPTTDITATRNIVAVWKGGAPIDRDAYLAARQQERAAAAAAPAAERGMVSDFEAGKPAAQFGSEWSVSTDALMGGKSTATIAVTSGGAAQSKGALAIAGEIAPGSPFAWAGAMWYPGPTPMAPANLAGGDGITFWAKGDGAEYRLMVFTQSKGRMPLTKTFVAGPEWKRFRFAFTDFEGSEGRDVTGILFAAGPAPGTFELSVDDVGLE